MYDNIFLFFSVERIYTKIYYFKDGKFKKYISFYRRKLILEYTNSY